MALGDRSNGPSPDAGPGDASWEQEYSLRKYLLLLATVVASVTYAAGFSPPGGVWEDSDPAAGYTAGEPIIRHTSYRRYVAFFYLNAAAFGSSLVVIVLVLIISIRHDMRSGNWKAVHVLRGFMVLDLLSIMGAYTAGIYRKRDVPVYTMILAALTIVYVVVFHMVLPSWRSSDRHPAAGSDKAVPSGEPAAERLGKEYERPRKVLLLLATFAVSVTFVAGLSAPGGFRDDYEGGHVPREPVLMGGRHETRLKAFVNFNSTAFFFSLLIAVQLVDKNLRIKDGEVERDFRYYLLYGSIVLALLGLVCAYATGSSRDRNTTIYVTLLGVAVPACIILVRVLLHHPNKGHSGEPEAHNNQNQKANSDGGEAEDKARSLVLLLATLAATITYQAGLDPPGGLWESNGNGYVAGDPIMRTTSPRRYHAFFYCNSGAFVASLVSIILVKKRLFKLETTTIALQAAMILDLFGLIGAYAAGSCRDVSTSIYATALAGAVLIYVVIHVVFFTLDHKDASAGGDGEAVLEKRRKRLLLFSILAATITYQAGLMPPGAFWIRDEAGHHAGDPVLLSNFPTRYQTFFYCNSVSFMLSIALIILLVNPNLYRPAIRSHALSVCTAVGTISLVGAFAAGSTHYLRTTIKIFGLVAAILIVAILALAHLHHVNNGSKDKSANDDGSTDDGVADDNKQKDKQLHAWRKHLMVLGILVASITYQAGLEPPGGVWQDDDGGLGHIAGNPIMRDNGRTRYLAFFYTNSISFVASVVVIILLLLNPAGNKAITKKLGRWFNDAMDKREEDKEFEWWMSAMNMTIELDLLGLLVAYAVGSTRSWKATGYVFALVFSVLAYIALHGVLVRRISGKSDPKQGTASNTNTSQGTGTRGCIIL